MLKIYHNPRCSKSRAGLKYLVDNGIDHEVVEYLNLDLTPQDIKELAEKTGLQPIDLVKKTSRTKKFALRNGIIY